MNELLEYLKSCGTFYLATCEGDQPHTRPFGAVCEFEGKLYIATNNKKDVFAQMKKNPKVEISGMDKGTWIRVKAKAIQDDRLEAREAMLKEYGNVLGKMYSANDHLMEVLYLEDVTATIYSMKDAPRVIV